MCGRFTSSQRREAIAERFQVSIPEAYSERYNLAPTQNALIVRERDDNHEAALVRWGLLPHWARDERISYKLINARGETLTEKPAFRSLLGKHRCLVVADGFDEWRIGADGKKEPVHFRLANGGLFGFAGLWTRRRDEATGETTESCTIITTRPNDLVAPIHDRMPVILSQEMETAWLDPELQRDHALELLQPFDASAMTATVASRLVNSVKNDRPELLVPNALSEAA